MRCILSSLAGPHPRSLLARRRLRRFPPAARSGRRRFIFAAVVGGLVISAAAHGISQQAAQPTPDKIIHAGRLIDGVASAPRERVSILIAGDRIIGIRDGFTPPQGAQVIDLSRATVMPGFIDSHTHITGEGTENAIVKAVTLDAVDDAVRSTAYAKRTLEAGFTTIRNVGARGWSRRRAQTRD